MPHGNFFEGYTISADWDGEWALKDENGFMLPTRNGTVSWGGGRPYHMCPQRAYEKFASRDITKTGFPFFDSGDASFEIEVAPDRKSVKIRAKSESPMRGDHTLMEKGKDVGKCIITQEFTLEFGAEPVIKDLKIGQTFA